MQGLGNDKDWTLVIRPKQNPFSIDFREIYRYRDLIFLFVKRDFTTVYKQTILGPIWFILQPVFTTIVYIFIFGKLAKLSTDGIPQTLFYFTGTALWTFFSNSLLDVSDTFVTNTALFGKVYFPRLTVPVSKVIYKLISFGIQLATLAVLYIYEVANGAGVRPSWLILALPAIVLWVAAVALGSGMMISALTTKYRDLRQLLNFGMQLWMYATPIVWPLSQLPKNLVWVAYLNPVTAPFEFFRVALYGRGTLPSMMICLSLGLSTLLVFFGLILFHKNESTFIDVA